MKAVQIHATTSVIPESGGDGVVWHRVNLLDPGAVANLVQCSRPTHLLHLAWVTTPGQYWTSSDNGLWLTASRALVQAFVEVGGERVVVTGTCAEYDWASTNGVCDEANTPLCPNSPYGKAKDSLRSHLQQLADGGGFTWAWGRLFWLYGPGEPLGRLVPTVARAVLAGLPAVCTAAILRRDFVYVEDVAQTLVDLLELQQATGAFNLGTGVATAVGDIALAIGRAAGRADLVQLGGLDLIGDDPPLIVAEMRRARAFLPARATTPIEEGLARSLAWWRQRS